MPFKSQKQRAWGHSKAGMKALGGAEKVAEWEKDTPSKLPERVGPKKQGETKPKMKSVSDVLDYRKKLHGF